MALTDDEIVHNFATLSSDLTLCSSTKQYKWDWKEECFTYVKEVQQRLNPNQQFAKKNILNIKQEGQFMRGDSSNTKSDDMIILDEEIEIIDENV